jgi:micrococcal nuclease
VTMPVQAWVFRAQALTVVDGDTLDLLIDCGLHGRRVERVRLLHVDTPETRGVADRLPGLAAKAFAQDWLRRACDWNQRADFYLVIRTVKTDNFGRYLAEVWRDCDGASLNDDLLTAGMAVHYEG